jgi:hypothetical protein
MGLALARLAAEDPSFRVTTDHESGQTIIKGMGELHLEILVDRMKREFKVEANVGAPQVAYRESLAKAVDVDYTHKKQSGGSGQFGRVKVSVAPGERGSGVQFIDEVKGGNIPREYIPSVEKGMRETAETGSLIGFPIIDFEIHLLDGAYHDVDSSALAFEITGRGAMREAAQKAGIKLPRADDEGRSRDAGGLHGRRHRRSPHSRAGRSRAKTPRQRQGRSRRWCRSPTCSATSTSCGRSPRGGRSTRCSSRITRKCRRTSPTR